MDSEKNEMNEQPGGNQPQHAATPSADQLVQELQEENRRLASEVEGLKKRLSAAQPDNAAMYARALLDATPLIATLWNVYGNLIDCNQEAVRVFGLHDRSDYIEHFYQRIPECQPNGENSRRMIRRIAGEVMATGYQRVAWMSRTATGEPMPFEVTAVRIPCQDGYCIVCYARDLREINNQERQVRALEERVRLLLDHTPLICTLWDTEGNLLDCNQQVVDILGLQDKAEVVKNFYDWSPEYQPNGERSRDMARRVASEVRATGCLRYEWMARSATGEPVPVETVSVLMPWDDGDRIISYTHDLSEIMEQRRQAREAEERARVHLLALKMQRRHAQEAEARARILLDASPIGASLWLGESGIMDCNQELLRMFGFSHKSEYIHGKYNPDPEFQPDGAVSQEKRMALVYAALETGYQQFEWMYRLPSGEPLPAEVTLVRIPWLGDWCIAAYSRDLREIKMQERQKLEAEARAKVLLDTTPLGATLWDQQGEIVFCNQEILRMFGVADMSTSDYAARFYAFSPECQPDGTPSREKGEALMDAAFVTGHSKFEWMHITASGEPLPTEVTLVRVPWQGGWCIAAYTRDLRERLARREAEERARMLLDAMPQIVFLWDEQLNLIDCNQEGQRAFGLDSIPDLSDYARRLNPEFQPDGSPSVETMQALIRKTFETGREQLEWMHRTVSGDELPVEKTLMRIPWKDGWRVASYNRDLREIKAQEQHARDAEEHARILLDTTPLGAGLWDEENNLLLCNQALLRMFGVADKAEFMARFHEFHPQFQPDGTPSEAYVPERVRKVFAAGYLKFEWMHCTLAGEPLPTEKTMIRVPWKGGWCVASYTRDLRETKAHHEAEERGRIMLDAIPDAVLLVDEERNILDHNQAFLRMFGFSDHLTRMVDFHAISPEVQPDGTLSLEQAIARSRAAVETGYQKFEWMHRTLSGEPLPTEVTLVRVPWRGSWCTAACIHDLRGAKAHEQQMREAHAHAQSLEVVSKAAQMASQAKSEFLARMSHELRTPLHAVIGFLGLELQKTLPAETVERLEISLDSCCNLLHLINDILDISKIEAGRFELTEHEYRPASFITEVISLNAFRMEGKLITFHLEVDPNLPSKLRGDDLRIKQVLTNLLSNAFKYTELGTVTLAVGLAPGNKEQTGALPIRFSIQDTGQGIKAENLERLFTSYSRFDSKANRLIEGTGLGLAISKNLVEMMGGRMEVESTYGTGSVFSCIIPQAVVDPTPIGHETVRSLTSLRDAVHQHRNKRYSLWQCSHLPYAKVLVVDDVLTNLTVGKAMLERYGMTVECVSSGQEAIDLVRSGKTRYNAIFMDHMMPGMDGIEALRRIRTIDSPYARSVPVIILTANVIAGNEKMFLDHGFQAFLSKPIDPAQLDAVINRWIKDARQEIRPGSPKRRRSDMVPSCPSAGAEPAPAADDAVHADAVAGLDMREAVARFGDTTVFFEVLRSYAASMPELLERMRRPTEEKLAEFTITAHGIKGTSYSVGANALGDMAKELEQAAADRDWPKVQEALPAFLEAAEELLRGIVVLLRERMGASAAADDKPLKSAPDPGELAALYQASLSCAHSTLEQRLQALERYRYQTDGELVAWLRERVDSLDYDQISERLAGFANSSSS